jgi:hypothetical protein
MVCVDLPETLENRVGASDDEPLASRALAILPSIYAMAITADGLSKWKRRKLRGTRLIQESSKMARMRLSQPSAFLLCGCLSALPLSRYLQYQVLPSLAPGIRPEIPFSQPWLQREFN